MRVLAKGRPAAPGLAGEPRNVLLADLLDALLEGHGFSSPLEAWRARVALWQRVIALTEAMSALIFVEGDA